MDHVFAETLEERQDTNETAERFETVYDLDIQERKEIETIKVESYKKQQNNMGQRVNKNRPKGLTFGY